MHTDAVGLVARWLQPDDRLRALEVIVDADVRESIIVAAPWTGLNDRQLSQMPSERERKLMAARTVSLLTHGMVPLVELTAIRHLHLQSISPLLFAALPTMARLESLVIGELASLKTKLYAPIRLPKLKQLESTADVIDKIFAPALKRLSCTSNALLCLHYDPRRMVSRHPQLRSLRICVSYEFCYFLEEAAFVAIDHLVVILVPPFNHMLRIGCTGTLEIRGVGSDTTTCKVLPGTGRVVAAPEIHFLGNIGCELVVDPRISDVTLRRNDEMSTAVVPALY